MPSSMETITVISSKGDMLKMSVGAAMQSKVLEGNLKDDCVVDKVPINNVKTETLVKVIEYCQKHADHDATKANGRALNFDVDELIKRWDTEFINNVDENTLLDILMAAYYLDIEGLMDLTCQTVANLMNNGMSLEQVRNMFNLKNDFTPEEQERIRRQHPGCAFD